MKPPHEDRGFGHGIHIFLIIITLGGWLPVWLMRWTMHKVDRTREAVYDISVRLGSIEDTVRAGER